MSDHDSSSDEERRLKAAKKEKKEKKEKKRSKSKASPAEEENAAEDPPSTKKRKREALPDEIEIDVNLPEPVSKKAARLAKKAKTQPPTANGSEPAENAKAGTTGTAGTAGGTADKDAEAKRSAHSVWIGNLPWTATKELLLTFLTTNAEMKADEITRIHMPAPKAPPRPNWTTEKPQNKGFAYVDFSTELAMYSAIALTETRMDNRPLLIKNSRNFEGRPDKPKEEEAASGATGGAGAARGGRTAEAKAPAKKIFVGNLAFETTKEDLEEHFGQCGTVEHIHMATFEDSGKSKGFAWVTFSDIDAATSATRGFVFNTDDAGKKRKWKLNKLMGRDLRCEFAEDGTTRYQKRYGKEKKQHDGGPDVFDEGGENVHPSRRQRSSKPEGRSGGFQPRGKVDPRTIRPGAAHSNAPRASAAIVQAKGAKISFD
ncbi:RNA-binding domain-containing protein [Massarina eburnea CBS 473.64]|uniref:RNA-binding domain-containing protein n=1 Tax=Massarina eburnea CBS 473.64 TaxID=1395130 RepID=A0A6A6RNP7_9PLEO|nr:RNA-binding domain-containing protein [Massarina eburnea CBS 473.64]